LRKLWSDRGGHKERTAATEDNRPTRSQEAEEGRTTTTTKTTTTENDRPTRSQEAEEEGRQDDADDEEDHGGGGGGGGERRSGRKTCGARFEPTVESGSATESTKAEQASKGGEAAR
jgi:hypothetical protein